MTQVSQHRHMPQRMMHVRGANRALVLQVLRKNPHLSRAELARRTGLSEGAVSRITAELLLEKLIFEQGSENSTGGRPGQRLDLDATHYRSVGVEVHEWQTRVSAGTLSGEIVETEWFRTPESATDTLDQIAARVLSSRDRHPSHPILGVGISLRGIIDDERGAVKLGSTPQWTGVRVTEYLQERIGIPVHVENNVRVAALAEYTYGGTEIHNSRCLLLVRVDEGVGLGIVLNGELYRGPRRAAGEFGQMVVADSPGGGAHDRPGSLERLAANPAIASRYAALAQNGKAGRGDTESRVRTICHLAMQGDPHAAFAVREAMRYLGIGVANAVWTLDPDVVLVHGAVTEAWPLVMRAIQEQFPTGQEIPHFRDLILRPCALGQDSGIIGAMALPFVSIFATGHVCEPVAAAART
ncbi:MAG TPA: ROK family transcriptional regulator [Bryobacteraceae bacterium]|nr:ROK family transcriptional regulator [Bryobacteraceae bacterium]